jgi:hypothetical protein
MRAVRVLRGAARRVRAPAAAGDARREEGVMRGFGLGLCRKYERLLPLVREDSGLGGF